MLALPSSSSVVSKPSDPQSDIYLGKMIDESSGLATLATKVPKLKKASSVQDMNRRERIRNSTVKLIDFFMKNPSQAVDIWASVDSQGFKDDAASKQSAPAAEAKDSFDVTTMGKLPVGAKARVIVSMPDGPTVSLMDMIYDKDKNAIQDMFYLFFRYDPKDRIPAAAKEASVFCQMCKTRLVDVRFDMKAWFEQSVVATSGAIDWTKKPLYQCHWQANQLHAITYFRYEAVPVVVPSRIYIPEGQCLRDFCNEENAHFKVDNTHYYLKDWFAKGQGPHEFRLDKAGARLDAIAQSAKADIQQQLQAVRAITDIGADCSLASRSKRQRQEALATARASRNTSLKEGRSMLFTSPMGKAIVDKVSSD